MKLGIGNWAPSSVKYTTYLMEMEKKSEPKNTGAGGTVGRIKDRNISVSDGLACSSKGCARCKELQEIIAKIKEAKGKTASEIVDAQCAVDAVLRSIEDAKQSLLAEKGKKLELTEEAAALNTESRRLDEKQRKFARERREQGTEEQQLNSIILQLREERKRIFSDIKDKKFIIAELLELLDTLTHIEDDFHSNN